MAEISTSVNQFTYQHFQGFKLLHLLFRFHLFVLRDSVIGGSLQLITPHIFPCFFNGLNIFRVFIVITRLALVSGRYKTKMNFKDRKHTDGDRKHTVQNRVTSYLLMRAERLGRIKKESHTSFRKQ